MGQLGRVRQIWRHPVKSMQGGRVDRAVVGPRGVVGDRRWAVRDVSTGAVLTAKRHPRLLMVTARAQGEGLVVTVPGQRPAAGRDADPLVSAFLGRTVALDVTEPDRPAFVDEADLHLLATDRESRWDVRRFRPNFVLDIDEDLDALVGERLWVGPVAVEVTGRTKRCGMTTAAQPGLDKDIGVLRALARETALCHGVYARVLTSGVVEVDDVVRIG